MARAGLRLALWPQSSHCCPMTMARQQQDRMASPLRLWLLLWLGMAIALLPGPMAMEMPGKAGLVATTPAMAPLQGREFLSGQIADRVWPQVAGGIVPSGVVLPAPRLCGTVSYARIDWKDPASRQIAPCARGPPKLS